jgi:serine/threonine protein kinase
VLLLVGYEADLGEVISMIMNARQKIGPYRLEKQIGYGSMSDVYMATDERNERNVAIKIIHPYLLDHPGMLERFTREAEALKSLRHPNIVRIYEYINQPDMAYLVMEAVDGGTLEERMIEAQRNGRFIPPELILRWMVDICEAVDFAHSQGMIHRDLKPSNILFRRNGQPVLSDFGLAFLMHHPRISSSN